MKVGIVRSITQSATDRPSDDSRVQTAPIDLHEAIHRKWGKEALITCYRPKDGREDREWVRYNSNKSPDIQLDAQLILLDYDLPEHQEWVKGRFQKTMEEITSIDPDHPLIKNIAYLYQTLHGFRIVYRIKVPVPVESIGGYTKSVMKWWSEKGFDMDPRSSEWTRLFYLPSVRKKNGEETDGLYMLEEPEALLDLKGITPVETHESSNSFKTDENLSDDLPDISAAKELLKHGKLSSSWARVVRAHFKGTETYSLLFDHDYSLIPEGSRHNKLLHHISKVSDFVTEDLTKETTPEHLFALFYDLAASLEPDNDTPCWITKMWELVRHFWEKDIASARAADQLMEIEKEQFSDVLLNGVRQWNPDADAAFVLRHSIITSPSGGYFLLRPDGWYDTDEIKLSQIIPRARELGMDQILNLEYLKKDGGAAWRQPGHIVNDYGCTISDVEGRVKVSGCFIDMKRRVLVKKMYSLKTDLKPEFNRYVHQWLLEMVGAEFIGLETPDKGICDWIGFALDFGHSIAALSLIGPQGTGKSMFVRGLEECIDTEVSATDTEMGDFQNMLAKTPFLWINEGAPLLKSKDASDYFRKCIDGENDTIRQIYKASVRVRNPMRLIMTANNDSIIRAMAGRRDLTPQDIEALALRIVSFRVRTAAQRWLQSKGGRNFTKGWVANEGGGESNYTVAKHFLWIHEQVMARRKRDNRFLMEGKLNNPTILNMAVRMGPTPVVIETLCSFVNESLKTPNQHFHVQDGKIYVTSHGIVSHFRSSLAKDVRKTELSDLTVLNACRILRPSEDEDQMQVFKVQVSPTDFRNIKARWIPIDAEVLLRHAQEYGYPCNHLTTVVHDHKQQIKDFENGKEL